ncbi:MAG: histone-like nucleoid-structuring protein Lsr2 [Mycobacteriales bacterium]
MSQKVQVLLIDDLDGGPADETIAFALDGSAYEIDLSKKNAAVLREAMAGYVGKARRAGRGPARAPAPRTAKSVPIDRDQAAAIRGWARRNGHTVSDRGRIPANVVDAYNFAH